MKAASEISGIKVIDVQQPAVDFIKELLSCEVIISSSLHGLILSDAYGIPNKWITFEDELKGGDFKFKDYYSTTSDPGAKSCRISSAEDFRSVISDVDEFVSVKQYMGSLDELKNAFHQIKI